MAVEETGLKFTTENSDQFERSLNDASGAVDLFEKAGEHASEAFNVFEEIVVGALRHVGEIAVDAMLQAGQAIVDFGSDAVSEALDAEKNLAKLNAVIKSTGGEAGVTSDYAQELAMRFRDLAGGSDDAVLSIEEVALRAGNISKKELPDFIQQTLDLAQVMGSAEAAATLLARSEEDPVAAMGKAQRAGIVFSKALKEQIKQLVKDGKTKEANALFTKRLAEATSGLASSAAQTTSGQWEILTGHFKEAEETIGTALIPAFMMLFDNVLKPAMPMLEEFASSIANIITLLLSGDFKGGIFGLQEDDPFITFLFDVRDGFISLGQWIMSTGIPVFNSISDWVRNVGLPAFFSLSDWIRTVAIPAFFKLSDWFVNVALPAVQPVINAFGRLLDAIKIDDPDAFTAGLDSMFSAFSGLWEKYIQPALQTMWDRLVAWVIEQAPKVKAEFERWRTAMIAWTEKVAPILMDHLGEALGKVTAWLVLEGIPGLIRGIWDTIQYILGLKQVSMEESGKSFFGAFVRGLASNENWAKIQETINQLHLIIWYGLNRAAQAAEAILDGMSALIVAIWNRTIYEIRDAYFDFTAPLQDGIIRAINFLRSVSFQFWSVGFEIVQGIAEGIRGGAFSIFSALWSVINDAINNIRNLFGIHSPSTLTADIIGAPIGEGIAEGIMSAVGQVQKAMAFTAGGGMVSPVSTSGSTYNNSNSISNSKTFQLNVNSAQQSQGVISDFSILQAMA